jgi:putative ABC transport system permease protein
MLTEGIALALGGSVLGTLLSAWAIAALRSSHLVLGQTSLTFEARLDVRSFAVSLMLAFSTGILVSLVPARRLSRADPQSILRESASLSSGSTARNRAQKVFVVAQIASTAVLLALAGRATQTYVRFNALDVGFDYARLVSARFSLPGKPGAGQHAPLASLDRVRQRLLGIPGVEAASVQFREVADWIGKSGERNVLAIDRAPAPLEVPTEFGEFFAVDPGFFATLRIPFLRGRTFTDGESASGPPVAILNELAARRWWPGQDPIGKRLRFGRSTDPSPWFTVIGIVGTAKGVYPIDLTQGFRPMVYFSTASAVGNFVEVFVRPRGPDAEAFVAPVRAALLELAPDRSAVVMSQRAVYRQILDPIRGNVLAILTLASCGLLLAMIGTYGVTAYAVGRRTQEIGVRVALGAHRASILGLVLREGLILVVLGLSLGLSGALAATQLMRSILWGAQGSDLLTLVGVAAIFFLTTLIASAVPAGRATRIDPILALRSE